MKIRSIVSLALVAAAQAALCQAVNLQTALSTGDATPMSATVQKVQDDVMVTFLAQDWPTLRLQPANPYNWASYNQVCFQVTNPNDFAVPVRVRIDDAPDQDGSTSHTCYYKASVPANTTQTLAIPIVTPAAIPASTAYGMATPPPSNGALTMTTMGTPVDFSHVYLFNFFMQSPSAATSVEFGPLVPTMVNTDIYTGIVDQFGQYTGGTWDGKVNAVSDMTSDIATEAADLAAHPAPSAFDSFGGDVGGPDFTGTGRFRTQKFQGKWWMVDPKGRIFLTMGMNSVMINDWTKTTGRENMFTYLPSSSDPLSAFVSWWNLNPSTSSGNRASFYAMNLARKYGMSNWYVSGLQNNSTKRLKSWGFNTMGAWSDAGVWSSRTMPYTHAEATTWYADTYIKCGTNNSAQLPDPFAASFQSKVAPNVANDIKKIKGDPNVIGYFVDNEMPWAGIGEENGRYGVAYGTLAMDGTSPAKKQFMADLQAKYGTIDALNSAWGTTFSSWTQFASPINNLATTGNANKIADFSAFTSKFAKTYFSQVATMVHSDDPGAMYLGCRFLSTPYEVVAAAAQSCDIMSFNIYAPTVDTTTWNWLNQFDKPCMISEFDMGATDHGVFGAGLVPTADQGTRAAQFSAYVKSILDNPYFVGCHWFQYVDEPLTGASYGMENFNQGFVDVVDRPYPKLVSAARSIFSGMYQYRLGW